MPARYGFILGIALTIATTHAMIAQAATKIEGFGPYKFLMSISELEELQSLKLNGSQDFPEMGATMHFYQGQENAQIGRTSFNVIFWIVADTLVHIRLTSNEEAEIDACERESEHIVGMIAAKYGAPDPVLGESESPLVWKARFTDPNGNSIGVVSSHIVNSCIIVIDYGYGGGGSF